jgi:hypothetical protein
MEVDMDVGDWLDSLLPSAQNTIRYRYLPFITYHISFSTVQTTAVLVFVSVPGSLDKKRDEDTIFWQYKRCHLLLTCFVLKG